MPASVIIAFIVVFALILLAASVGLKFFDARRRSQVSGMLNTAAGETVVTISNLLKEIESEKPGGLKHLLSTLHFTKHAQELIYQAGMDWSPNRLLKTMAVMAVPGLVLGAAFPLIVNAATTGIVLAGVFALMPYMFLRKKRQKRLDKLEEQFPEALDFLARSMRAGHAFTISLEMLGQELGDPLGLEFRTLFNEQNLGAPLEMALQNFNARVPLVDANFFTSSIMLQRQTGGNLSEILQRLAHVIRERFRLKGQVKAASAHGRLTATILTLLPIATMVALLMAAPGYLQGMANDPDGKLMIGGAVAAQVLGNFFIKRIIAIKV